MYEFNFSRWTRSLLIGCMVIYGGVHAASPGKVIIKQVTMHPNDSGILSIVAIASHLGCAGMAFKIYSDRSKIDMFRYTGAGVMVLLSLASAVLAVKMIRNTVADPRTMLELSPDGFWHWERGLVPWDMVSSVECSFSTIVDRHGEHREYILNVLTKSGDVIVTPGNCLPVDSSYLVNSIRTFYAGKMVVGSKVYDAVSF